VADDVESVNLSKLLPPAANDLCVDRVSDILASPRSVREGWSDQQAERFLNGETSVPPWVGTLVTGSLVRPEVPEAAWSAALLTTPPGTTLESIAGPTRASVEKLGEWQALRGAADAIFLEVHPGLLGVMSPALRQDAARWSHEVARGGESEVSPLLLEAAALPGHIVFAMDLRHLLDAEHVRRRLGAEEALLTAPRVVTRVAAELAGLQGVTLSIVIGDEFAATVTIQFAAPPAESPALYRGIFLSVLGDSGAGIEEFDSAAATVEGGDLVLRTNLSEASVRRILSLIVPPPPRRSTTPAAPQVTAAPPTTPVPSPQPAPGAATRRYVLAVNKMIDDLKVANRNAKNYERTATWHDNFARKIANLATEGVDKDVVGYGLSVADRFRALAASLRGQAVQVAAAEGTLTYSYGYDPGWVQANWWGGVGYRAPTYSVESNLREVRQRQSRAVEAGALDRTKILKLIDDDRAAIATMLRQRYGDDFLRR
jgi:hypothetical protein